MKRKITDKMRQFPEQLLWLSNFHPKPIEVIQQILTEGSQSQVGTQCGSTITISFIGYSKSIYKDVMYPFTISTLGKTE